MIAKHTPAPWFAKGKIYNEIYAKINGIDDWKIAKLTAAKIGHNEARANAHLIAAAPELLEALEGLLENYKYNQAKGLGIGPIMKAKTAIEKAKGETP